MFRREEILKLLLENTNINFLRKNIFWESAFDLATKLDLPNFIRILNK